MSTPRVVTLHNGTKYDKTYVEHLYSMLVRHTTVEWDFEVIRQNSPPGWWRKLLVFPPRQRTIFLDLDIVIVGNIDFLFKYDGSFCIWDDPWTGRWNSSVMSIGPRFGQVIRDYFLVNPDNVMRRFHGDQDVICELLWPHGDTWQKIAPDKIKSYKADRLDKSPGDAAIAVFHGDPKPHTIDKGWVHDSWI